MQGSKTRLTATTRESGVSLANSNAKPVNTTAISVPRTRV